MNFEPEILSKQYTLETSSVMPLALDSFNQLFKVMSKEQAYFVKVFTAPEPLRRDVAELNQVAQVMQQFHHQAIPVHLPLVSKHLEWAVDYQGHALQVSPYHPGKTISAAQCQESQAFLIGQTLAKIHQCQLTASGFSHEEHALTTDWTLLVRGTKFASMQADLECLSAAYNAVLPRLTETLVLSHGDLTPNNVLWTSETEFVIVDWDLLRFVNPAMELLACAQNWGSTAVMRGYQSVSGKLPVIDESTHLAVAASWLRWLLWLMDVSADKPLMVRFGRRIQMELEFTSVALKKTLHHAEA